MIAYVFQKYSENFVFELFNFAVIYPWNFLLSIIYYFLLSFLFINKTLRLNNLKTRKAMNAKVPVFVTCVEASIYLLLYNLHDCTFNAGYSEVY